MIRVLVVDDQASVRSSLRLLLKPRSGIEVIGEASSGPAAVAMAARLAPDVVLMDVRMPDGDGIAATRQLTDPDTLRPIPVVVMTMFEDDEYLFGALRAGASGFVLKSADHTELVAALRYAAQGRGMLSPAVVKRVVAEFARQADAAAAAPAGNSRGERPTPAELEVAASVTRRELEVLQALARGLSDSDIAAELHIETSTIKGHLSHLRAKTGMRNRTQLLLWALRTGLASPGGREAVGGSQEALSACATKAVRL